MTRSSIGRSSGGFFSLSKLVKQSNMAISTNTDGTHDAVSDIFTCDDGAGITSVLPAADYTVSVDLFGNNMTALGTAARITATITGPNKVTPLGLVTIPIIGP